MLLSRVAVSLLLLVSFACGRGTKSPVSLNVDPYQIDSNDFANFSAQFEGDKWENRSIAAFFNSISSESDHIELKQLQTIFTYDAKASHLIVKGMNVTLSDVVKNENWANAVFIDIFALNQVQIDANITKMGEMPTIAIFAPRWHFSINSKSMFILDGRDADSFPSAARDGFGRAVNGDDGKGGMPGGAAGHFIGIGINSDHYDHFLGVRAVGGNGGNGQTGGNGKIMNKKIRSSSSFQSK